MTIEEWFDKEYPESTFASHMQVIRLSLKEVAQKAWDASYDIGFEDGYNL